MPNTAITIILISTLLHASWNLMVRHKRSEIQFVFRMLLAIVAIGLIPMIIFEFFLAPLGARLWILSAISGIFCGLYFTGLAKGYENSDFTFIYPIARALPVLFIAVADVILGRWPTSPGWLGLSLIVMGCLLAPQTSFRVFRKHCYANRAFGWVLLAAMGTIGYSLTDKIGATELATLPLNRPLSAARYTYVFFVVALIVYSFLTPASRRRRTNSPSPGWLLPLTAGLLNWVSYLMIICALQITNQVSYVVAFRQFSIVIGVFLAFIIFKEPGAMVRMTASLLITSGLILIALWGAC